MCLLAIAWRPSPALRLLLVGNRDEFHARAAAPMHWWDDEPRLLAGRDLQAGGTWFGVGEDGRFAVVTNFRGGAAPPAPPSRGELIPAYLRGNRGAVEYLDALATRGAAYAGFSLLAGDADDLAYYSNRDPAGPRRLGAGVYGLGNGLLDTPWPKLLRVRSALARQVGDVADPLAVDVDALVAPMTDRAPAPDHELPDTGVGPEWERRLSSPFVVGAEYGTRCTTVLAIAHDGRFLAVERAWDAEGRPAGARRFERVPAPA